MVKFGLPGIKSYSKKKIIFGEKLKKQLEKSEKDLFKKKLQNHFGHKLDKNMEKMMLYSKKRMMSLGKK